MIKERLFKLLFPSKARSFENQIDKLEERSARNHMLYAQALIRDCKLVPMTLALHREIMKKLEEPHNMVLPDLSIRYTDDRVFWIRTAYVNDSDALVFMFDEGYFIKPKQ